MAPHFDYHTLDSCSAFFVKIFFFEKKGLTLHSIFFSFSFSFFYFEKLFQQDERNITILELANNTSNLEKCMFFNVFFVSFFVCKR
jgi:hypothetical protein